MKNKTIPKWTRKTVFPAGNYMFKVNNNKLEQDVGYVQS